MKPIPQDPRNRQEILEDEFIRVPFPGLRLFSVGVLKLARKLRLGFALPASERVALSPEEGNKEDLASTYLLDASHSPSQLAAEVGLGRERFFNEFLPAYEFRVAPALSMLARQEIALTNAAVEAAAVIIEPKPGATNSPEPGNS